MNPEDREAFRELMLRYGPEDLTRFIREAEIAPNKEVEPVAEPFIGYRTFSMDDDLDLHPIAVQKQVTYKPERNKAGFTALCAQRDHPAPAADCDCGFYAVKEKPVYSAPPGFNPFGELPWLGAEVLLWGRIQEHSRGYRAQHMSIRKLFLPANLEHLDVWGHWPDIEIEVIEPTRPGPQPDDYRSAMTKMLYTWSSATTNSGAQWHVEDPNRVYFGPISKKRSSRKWKP